MAYICGIFVKTKEEIFRTQKGAKVASFLIKDYGENNVKQKLIQLNLSYLNKTELQELIDWLISKLDEME